MERNAERGPSAMATIDPELIAILEAGSAPPFEALARLSSAQLEKLRLLALLQIALDPKAPSAARVAALKSVQDGEAERGSQGQETDPSALDLDAINRELASH